MADGTNAGIYTITVTRAGSVPGAPTGLTATVGESGDVTLSWTAPAAGGAVSGYEYQQKAGTGPYGAWTPIPGSGPTTTSHIVTGLTSGTAYTFRVRAVNSVGAGAASNEATATSTARLVWAKSEQEVAAVIAAAMAAGLGDDMTFDAGEQVEILGSALFNAASGVTLSYTAVSSDSNVASAGIVDTRTVTVTARAGGMADITITATASLPSGVTINPQTDPREASITFPVEVDIEALVLELVGPTDMNLVEGGSDHANGTAGRATVTARANRPLTREVTVTLLVDRAVSEATADDFVAAPIVLGAGATAGSTVVTAVDDGTEEAGKYWSSSAWRPTMRARCGTKSRSTSGMPRCRPCRSSPSSCWRRSWPSAGTAGTGGGSVRRRFVISHTPSPPPPRGEGVLPSGGGIVPRAPAGFRAVLQSRDRPAAGTPRARESHGRRRDAG